MGWLGFITSAAFAAGLLGGVHCAAMCGPIVAACSSTSPRRGAQRWSLALSYNAGRLASYTAAGALAGFIGQASLALRGDSHALIVLPLVASASLMLMALYIAGVPQVKRALEAAGGVLWRWVRPWSKQFLPANTILRAVGLGAVWGWLPCGMVYAVLVTAVAAGDAGEGALIMLAFGLGTLPNVLAIGALTSRLKSLRQRAVRLSAAAAIASFALVGALGTFHAHGALADVLYCFTPQPTRTAP
jgi:uncharacterized protein